MLGHGETLGIDEGDIRQANEAEHAPEIGLVEIHALARALAVDAAARRHDEHLLAAQQALGSVRAVAKGASRPDDVIDPGLKSRGHGEIVHRRPDHDDISRLQLLDQAIGERGSLGMLRRALLDRGHRGTHHRAGDMGHGIGHEIALDHPGAGVTARPGLDKLAPQRPGLGILPEDARGDEKKLAHGYAPIKWERRPVRRCHKRSGFISIHGIAKIWPHPI